MQANISISHTLWLEEMSAIEGGAGEDCASLAWADGEERLPSGLGLG